MPSKSAAQIFSPVVLIPSLVGCALLSGKTPVVAGILQVGAVLSIDTDGDGVDDLTDVDPTHFNAAQLDFDLDHLGDDLEGKLINRDTDGDSVLDYRDLDSDNDGKPD